MKKYDFYFDDVYCVDASTNENIPNVKCDGKQTFDEAKSMLEQYFNIN